MVEIDLERHKKAMRIGIHYFVSALKKDKKTVDNIIRKSNEMDKNDCYSFLHGIFLATIAFREVISDKFNVDFDKFTKEMTKILNEEVDLLDSVRFGTDGEN